MEPTENTKPQIMLETIEILDDDEAEYDSSETTIEDIVEYKKNTREDKDKYFKTEIQLDPLEIKDEESDETSISTQEAEARMGEKGLSVKRKHEEDDDVEVLDDIVNGVVEVGLPLNVCCTYHHFRIEELEHQLKLCHEVINTFIKKSKVELEVRESDRPEYESSEEELENKIGLLRLQNDDLLCELEFMKIKEENFQSRLNHLLHLLNTERDIHDQLKATRSREQSRWNTLKNGLEKTIEAKTRKIGIMYNYETDLNVSLKEKETECVQLSKEIESLNKGLRKDLPCEYCGL